MLMLYLTYEELKRFFDCFFYNLLSFVVPYLWGIETCIRYNICCQSWCVRCTLPMRNWNLIIRVAFFFSIIFCCTLPMRNWNVSPVFRFKLNLHSLYLTYEELKRFLLPWISDTHISCFVVPYLWGIETQMKPQLQNLFRYSWLYLTYEELKHFSKFWF